MTFTSLSFALFLPLVYLCFRVTHDRFRWLVLLVASYGFYASFQAPQLLVALGVVTALSYLCGVHLGRSSEGKRRSAIFWLGTSGCLLVLVLVKYLPPLLFRGAEGESSSLLLSLGVSYFCFQAISYLADVYLEVQEPEQHLGVHALSLAFFPKLLQGPIERAGKLLPQLKMPFSYDYDMARSGLLLFGWGLFRKVVVADRLALYVDQVYNDVHAYSGLPLLLATYAYALQIYFDFAGYTDMARGTARLFGIELTQNFNSPYLATSIADFWRRWHISFSRWILDYIFNPLQLWWRDHGKAGTAVALMVTFLVSGGWHGARLGFLVWGGLHGLYLAASTYYRPYQKRLHKRFGVEKSRWLKVWQVVVTFNMVSFAWIFFRAPDLESAFYLVKNLGHLEHSPLAPVHPGVVGFVERNVLLNGGLANLDLIALIGLTLTMVSLVPTHLGSAFFEKPVWVRWPLYYTLILCIAFLGVHQHSSFIYAKF